MIQKLSFILIVIIIVLTSLTFAYAELYKYVDENGVVSYTDNYSKVSEPSNKSVVVIEEIKTGKTKEKEDEQGKEDNTTNDIGQGKNELELIKISLDKEYNDLNIEKEKLVQEKNKITTNDEQIEYNIKVKELNARAEVYNKKSKDYTKLVDDYNNKVKEE